MPKAKVTVRQLKNVESGIDITITNCREQSSLLSVKLEYQILVVSNLSCFKSPEHTPEDVVQFVIKRRHEDFVELHRVLRIKYPSVILPSVSATGMALFQDVNIREQKESLDAFVKRVVSDKELATSYLTLQFLGVNAVVAGNFQRNRRDVQDISVTKGIFEEERLDDEDMFADISAAADAANGDMLDDGSTVDGQEEKEDDDLFAAAKPTGVGGDSMATRLFDEQDLGGVTEDISGLLLPNSESVTEAVSSNMFGEEEDDLLNITDDLDDLFRQQSKKTNVNKASTANKPKLAPKPGGNPGGKSGGNSGGKPRLPPKPGQSESKTTIKTALVETAGSDSDLGADDILKYIQEATSKQEEEVDLFS